MTFGVNIFMPSILDASSNSGFSKRLPRLNAGVSSVTTGSFFLSANNSPRVLYLLAPISTGTSDAPNKQCPNSSLCLPMCHGFVPCFAFGSTCIFLLLCLLFDLVLLKGCNRVICQPCDLLLGHGSPRPHAAPCERYLVGLQ